MLGFMNQLKSFTRTNNATQNPIILDGGRGWMKFSRSSPFFMTFSLPPRLASEMPSEKEPLKYPAQKSSTMVPPPHWHTMQDETFRVQSGKMLATVSGSEQLIGEGEEVFIPRGSYHTFANASSERDLVADVKLNPDNRIRDETFFRAAYGYQEDCSRANVTPSFLQTLLFLWSADVIPALPGPKFIMAPLAKFITWFGGVVLGKWLLGYREHYPEYTPRDF